MEKTSHKLPIDCTLIGILVVYGEWLSPAAITPTVEDQHCEQNSNQEQQDTATNDTCKHNANQ